MLIGYMRVSSESDRQITDLQRDALRLRRADPSDIGAREPVWTVRP